MLLTFLVSPASAVLLDFDGPVQPCGFASTVAARAEYAADGVTFEGPGANGGAFLDECGGFGVVGHSPPNFLAWNSGSVLANGGIPRTPTTMRFAPEVSSVSAEFGSSQAGIVTINAFDVNGVLVDSDARPLSPIMSPLLVVGAGIATVVVETTALYFVMDDLEFDGTLDLDGDGFGAPSDCDDNDPLRHPGAFEACDGVDNDCDPATLEDQDLDGDGWRLCDLDCDDGSAAVNPGAIEVCDGLDNDCDPSTGDGVDADGDGASFCVDCDDADPDRFPAAVEVCDGVDNDCDPATDEATDADGDGYRLCDLDCDDADPARNPGAVEVCDGLDNDCDPATNDASDGDGDGVLDCDDVCPLGDDGLDGDGDGAPDACDPCPADFADDSDDDGRCDSADQCPGSDDLADADADAVADGCDNCPDAANADQQDEDGDGFGSVCDCGPIDPAGFPGADERCNDRDDDCDGATDEDPIDPSTFYEDADRDGSGDAASTEVGCDASPGFVEEDGDCDDTDPLVAPGLPERCDNGVDDDCDVDVDEGCPAATEPTTGGEPPPAEDPVKEEGGCGCGTGPAGTPFALGVVMAGLARRRLGRPGA